MSPESPNSEILFKPRLLFWPVFVFNSDPPVEPFLSHPFFDNRFSCCSFCSLLVSIQNSLALIKKYFPFPLFWSQIVLRMRDQWGYEEEMKEALWNSKVFQCVDNDDRKQGNHQNNNALWNLKQFKRIIIMVIVIVTMKTTLSGTWRHFKRSRGDSRTLRSIRSIHCWSISLHTKSMSKKENALILSVKGSKICIAYHAALFTDARIDCSFNQWGNFHLQMSGSLKTEFSTLIEISFYFQVEDLLKRLDYVENDWNVLAKAPRRFGVSVTVPVGIFVLLIM